MRSEIGRRHRQRRRQIALHRRLPVLRVADAEVRIDRKGVGGVDGTVATNPLASVSGFVGAVLDAERRRQRRLLRQQHGDRLIDVGVAVDAVTGANDQRRTRAPDARRGRGAAGCRACPAGSANRDRSLPVTAPVGSLATTGATSVKPSATSRFTRRPSVSVIGASYSQRTPSMTVNDGLSRRSSLKYASY